MKKNMFRQFILWMLMISCMCAHAATDKLSLDLQDVGIQDALHYIAKISDINLILAPDIAGPVTLHLHNVSADEALDLILHSRGLTRIASRGVWLVGTDDALLKQKEQEEKLQQAILATAPLVTRVWQMHYARADDVLRFIQDDKSTFLSKRGNIHVDMRTNRVCVQDTAEAIAAINEVMQKLDVPVQQVLIETRLASVDLNFERTLGIDFSILSSGQHEEGAFSVPHYSLALAKLADGTSLDVRLAALENQGHGELLSSPRLLTGNHQSASIESGEEIPYQEISSSGATGVAFKKAVLSLKVTPDIFPKHKVLLQLQINQDKAANRMVQGVPAIATRQISTSILAEDGQTIVLGGIFETDKNEMQQRVPFLGKIPLVGLLFSQQNVTENKRELLIFVTPRIVNGESKT